MPLGSGSAQSSRRFAGTQGQLSPQPIVTTASNSPSHSSSDFDAVITMGCGDSCPWVPAKRREDWALPDPKGMGDTGYRAVRDDIAMRVRALLASL